MNIHLEIRLANDKVSNEGYDYIELVNHLANRKIYHTIALMIFCEVFKTELNFSKNHIYNHSDYSKFENEKNPFNEEFINEINSAD